MKKLFVTVVFALFAVITFGQEVSKQVQWRLNPILKSVEVTEAEKKELIVVIERFQKNLQEIRSSDNENKQAELKKNSQQYLKDVKGILGAERFNKWRTESKAKNNSSN